MGVVALLKEAADLKPNLLGIRFGKSRVHKRHGDQQAW